MDENPLEGDDAAEAEAATRRQEEIEYALYTDRQDELATDDEEEEEEGEIR